MIRLKTEVHKDVLQKVILNPFGVEPGVSYKMMTSITAYRHNFFIEDLNLFKSNLQKIRSASKQIIANVENSVEYAVRNLAKEKTETKEEVKEKVAVEVKVEENGKPKRTAKNKKKTNESEVE